MYTLPLDGSGDPQLLLCAAFEWISVLPADVVAGWQVHLLLRRWTTTRRPGCRASTIRFYETYRMAYPGGQPEKLADEAFWPRLSRDGARLAYVTLDPVDGSNKLFVANGDGSGAYQVALVRSVRAAHHRRSDLHVDDQNVLYSAITPQRNPPQPNWLERLFGVIVASAHTVPSDWWSVPIGGGTPTQLTHIAVAGLFGSLSPDGQYLASYSGNGIFVMKPDGTQLTMLVTDMGGMAGTVNWIP